VISAVFGTSENLDEMSHLLRVLKEKEKLTALTRNEVNFQQEAEVIWQRLHRMRRTQLSRVTDRLTDGRTD